MKWAALFLAAIGFFLAAAPARAQVQVSAQTARSIFLLYERVDLFVTVRNIGGTDLVLDNNEGHPWLSFLVSKHDGLPVRPERESSFAPLTIKSGETKTLSVNLTPLFAFRDPGQFTAAAVIDLPGAGQVISENVPFNIMDGHKVWTQERPVDGSQRFYSLIRFSPAPDNTRLYLRVENPSENVVYANLALGDIASFIDPEVNFDPQGDIHILQPVALGTYLYTRANADGKIQTQKIFKTFQQVPPRLEKMDDGNVTVAGGLLENPNAPRERLSDPQKAAERREPGAPPTAGTPEETP
jgi:hypothetical protein